jgi:hypothetical protein
VMATRCQSREVTEILSLLNGMWIGAPVEACHEAAVYEVHLEHVLGLRAALCDEHQQIVSTWDIHQRSVKLRVSSPFP